MTAQEIYSLALSFLSEKPQKNDLQDFILPWLNLLLQESLPYENQRRQGVGEEKLAAAPVLTAWEEEVPYGAGLVRIVLPYGLAALIFQDDDNDYRSQMYRNLYLSALDDAAPYRTREVADVYGEEE